MIRLPVLNFDRTARPPQSCEQQVQNKVFCYLLENLSRESYRVRALHSTKKTEAAGFDWPQNITRPLFFMIKCLCGLLILSSCVVTGLLLNHCCSFKKKWPQSVCFCYRTNYPAPCKSMLPFSLCFLKLFSTLNLKYKDFILHFKQIMAFTWNHTHADTRQAVWCIEIHKITTALLRSSRNK